jgi:hypothetical protein
MKVLVDIDYIKNCFIDLIDSGAKIREGSGEREQMMVAYICSVLLSYPCLHLKEMQ